MSESPPVAVGGVEVSVDHLIGGERVPSAETFECRSPLDWNRKLADVARGDAATAERAVDAAVDGFRAWSPLPVGERAAALRRLADLIEARNDDIALVETLDMGFLHHSMRERLVARGALNFRFYADMAEAYVEPRWPARGTTHTVLAMLAGLRLVGAQRQALDPVVVHGVDEWTLLFAGPGDRVEVAEVAPRHLPTRESLA